MVKSKKDRKREEAGPSDRGSESSGEEEKEFKSADELMQSFSLKQVEEILTPVRPGVKTCTSYSQWNSIMDHINRHAETTIEVNDFNMDVFLNPTMLAEIMEYQGMDVFITIKLLESKCNHYNNSKSFNVKTIIAGQGDRPDIGNKESFMTDMSLIIMIFCKRGSSWDKQEEKSTPQLKALMAHLKLKYDINCKKRKPGESIKQSVITVPRVLSCFPTIACDYYVAGLAKSLVSTGSVGLQSETFKALTCPFFPLVLCAEMAEAYGGTIHHLLFLVQVLLEDTVRDGGKVTPLIKQYNYYTAGLKSKSVPKRAKLQCCLGWDLISKSSDLYLGYQEVMRACEGAEGLLE